MRTTRSRRLLAVASAVAVLALDVAYAAASPTPFHHGRSPGALVVMVALAASVLVLVPRVSSVSAALGGGLAAGGALGMAISGAAWSGGVPDPLVGGGYAFNVADLAILLGDALLLAAVVTHAWRNRRDLRRPL